METRVAMGCSFALVLELPGLNCVTPDTSLLFASDRCKTAIVYQPHLVSSAGVGLDMQLGRSARHCGHIIAGVQHSDLSYRGRLDSLTAIRPMHNRV